MEILTLAKYFIFAVDGIPIAHRKRVSMYLETDNSSKCN